jgi:hypothetical protein
MRPKSAFCFVSGHDFSRAVKAHSRVGFSPCQGNRQGLETPGHLARGGTTKQAAEKLCSLKYGLQPVHKRLEIGTALAAEGRISIRLPTFSAASLVVP